MSACLNFQYGEVQWNSRSESKSDRSPQELSNEQDPYSNEDVVEKIGFDTSDNELRRVWITDLADHMSADRLMLRIVVCYFVFTIATE